MPPEGKDPISTSADLHKVLQIRFLTENTFILRLSRENMQFKAGQHIIVGLKGELDQREYSIYSGENDDHLEILVKEVTEGAISVKLKLCKPADLLQVNGPFGSFGIEPFDLALRKFVFIATGTGISPFHSMVKSNPQIDYTIIHGVRFAAEAYEKEEYDDSRYYLCTSGERNTVTSGRVTQFLSQYEVTPGTLFYLCGNGNMIYEVSNILMHKGVTDENIISERYF